MVRAHCGRCGREIDYDSPTFLVTASGRRTINPWTLHVAHIVPRRKAKQLGWSPAMINRLENRPAGGAAKGCAGLGQVQREGQAVRTDRADSSSLRLVISGER
jgi:hypothetical protein